jgi:uncharacterized membrane protein YfcA
MIDDLALPALILAACAFLAGGAVKGAFGFGLPLVTVPLLASIMPLVIYLVSLRLPKDEFVGTASFWNLFGCIPLYAGLAWHGFLTIPVAAASGGGAVIAMLGVWAGTWARGYLPQAVFRRILLDLLVIAGANLIRRSVM